MDSLNWKNSSCLKCFAARYIYAKYNDYQICHDRHWIDDMRPTTDGLGLKRNCKVYKSSLHGSALLNIHCSMMACLMLCFSEIRYVSAYGSVRQNERITMKSPKAPRRLLHSPKKSPTNGVNGKFNWNSFLWIS